MEALERRSLLMLVVAALLVVRGIIFPAHTWEIALYVFGLACLAAACILLVVVIAPAAYIGRWDSERGRLLFFAFALLVAEILVTVLIIAYEAASTRFSTG